MSDSLGALPLPPDVESGLVFLSHSSRQRDPEELSPDDKLNRHLHRKRFLSAVLEELQGKLEGEGFDVWWDRLNLRGGDVFDALIYDALALCDAAIVLVDRDALDSNYVRREVTILTFRASVGDGLTILPVLLGGVTDKELADSPLGRNTDLHTRLPVRPQAKKTNVTNAPGIVNEIVAALADRLESKANRLDSLTRRWIEDISFLLSGLSDDLLWRAAQSLGESRSEWLRNENKQRAIAASLLGSDKLDDVYAALREVVDWLAPHHAKLTVERTQPLWVDLHAARVVQDTSQLTNGRRVVGVSTRAYRLGRDVCLRATVASPQYRVLRLPDVVGEAPLQELTDRYDETIRTALNLSKVDEPETVTNKLSGFRGIYALMRCDTLDVATTAALVETMQLRFPGISLVLLGNRESGIWRNLPMEHAYSDLSMEVELDARRYVSQIAQLIGDLIPVDADD